MKKILIKNDGLGNKAFIEVENEPSATDKHYLKRIQGHLRKTIEEVEKRNTGNWLPDNRIVGITVKFGPELNYVDAVYQRQRMVKAIDRLVAAENMAETKDRIDGICDLHTSIVDRYNTLTYRYEEALKRISFLEDHQ